MNLLSVLCVFLAGIALSFQATINNQLASSISNSLLATCISFAIGALFLSLAVLLVPKSLPSLTLLTNQPVWRFSGGIFGAISVFGIVYFIPKLGLAGVLSLIITGQLIAALLIDHFGLLGSLIYRVSIIKLIGVFVLLIGAGLIIFGDQVTNLFKTTH